MNENKGFDGNQTKEVLINALIFLTQTFIYYVVEQNKIFAALSMMAALFSLYTIPLSKSDVKSTIVGSISVNIIVSILFITYYLNNFNIIFLSIWVFISIWFIYKLIEKIRQK